MYLGTADRRNGDLSYVTKWYIYATPYYFNYNYYL